MNNNQKVTTYDQNYQRYVGWNEYYAPMTYFYSPQTISYISKKITSLLQGLDKRNRPIIVPNQTIANVMDSVYVNYRPETGDIYGRYNVPNHNQQSQIQSMISQTIEIITSQIKADLGMREANSKLSAWVQVYGDFNEHGLTQTPPIKIREKRPDPMMFNMHY